MKQQKPDSISLIQYLLGTQYEELLEGSEITFIGATEKERQQSIVKFIRVRGLIQRFGREATSDENEMLISILKGCVVPKNLD